MAVLAFFLENRCDILGERHRFGTVSAAIAIPENVTTTPAALAHLATKSCPSRSFLTY